MIPGTAGDQDSLVRGLHFVWGMCSLSLNLVIVMMGQVMGWQCEFCPAMCMQCEGIYRKPSHAIDNSQCECEREPC